MKDFIKNNFKNYILFFTCVLVQKLLTEFVLEANQAFFLFLAEFSKAKQNIYFFIKNIAFITRPILNSSWDLQTLNIFAVGKKIPNEPV